MELFLRDVLNNRKCQKAMFGESHVTKAMNELREDIQSGGDHGHCMHMPGQRHGQRHSWEKAGVGITHTQYGVPRSKLSS